MSRPHVVPAVRAGALPAAIPAVMRSVDATLPVQELRTIEEQAAENAGAIACRRGEAHRIVPAVMAIVGAVAATLEVQPAAFEN